MEGWTQEAWAVFWELLREENVDQGSTQTEKGTEA